VRRTQIQAAKNVRGVGYTLIYMSSKYELGLLCSRAKSLIVLRKMVFRFFYLLLILRILWSYLCGLWGMGHAGGPK